jgi:hypothetical protein
MKDKAGIWAWAICGLLVLICESVIASEALLFQLTWDVATDVDLHLREPNGNVIYYGHQSSPSNAQWLVDDMTGTGPEKIWWMSSPPGGTYEYWAENYSGSKTIQFTLKVYQDGTLTASNTGTIPASAGAASTHYSFRYNGSGFPYITAGPTATPSPATVGQTVTFTVTASGPTGDTLDYTWDYGDGSQSYIGTASSTHTYDDDGMYRVKVTISSSVGSAEGTLFLMVGTGAGGNGPPPAPTSVTRSGSTVSFSFAGTADGFRVHYNWHDAGYYRDSKAFKQFTRNGQTYTIASGLTLDGDIAVTAFNSSGHSVYGLTPAAESHAASRQTRYYDCPDISVTARFMPYNHEWICKQALGSKNLPSSQLLAIAGYNEWTDMPNSAGGHFSDPQYHFDNGETSSGTHVGLADATSKIKALLEEADKGGEAATKAFGTATHVLNDFYAHSDFVEQFLNRYPELIAKDPDNLDALALKLMGESLTNLQDVSGCQQYVTGYYEKVEGDANKHEATCAVPASASSAGHEPCVTLHYDLETKEARPNGYWVGFVPWHGALNKDHEDTSLNLLGLASPEGLSKATDGGKILFRWARRFATLHTAQLYDCLGKTAQDALKTDYVAKEISAFTSGVIATLTCFGTANGTDTRSGLSSIISTYLSLTKGTGRNQFMAGGKISCVIPNKGDIAAAELFGKFRPKKSSSDILGSLTAKASGTFTPADSSATRSARLTLKGNMDSHGTFSGTANVSIKGSKGVPAIKLKVPWGAQVLP